MKYDMTLEEMIEYCQDKEKIPQNEDESFVLAYEHSNLQGNDAEINNYGSQWIRLLNNHQTFTKKFNGLEHYPCRRHI